MSSCFTQIMMIHISQVMESILGILHHSKLIISLPLCEHSILILFPMLDLSMNGQNHGIMHYTGVIYSPLLGQHSIQYVAHILIERIHGMMHHTGVINLLPLGKHSIQYVEHPWNDAPHRGHQCTAVG